MSRPISFLSDFGLEDEFVGVVHGVLAKIAPQSSIIDITHGVHRGEVREGALTLMRSIQYLPAGVALAVVDPGVGTDRRAIAVETEWGEFVGPDNGLLSPAVAMVGGARRIVSIKSPEFIIPSRGSTFAGRDLFAPAAAVLASGEAGLLDLGPELDPNAVLPQLLPLAEITERSVVGEAWWVDHFGNVETNISPEDLEAVGLTQGDTVLLVVGSQEHQMVWRSAYGEAAPGEAMIHVDSYGMIAVVVRDARADQRFGLADGTAVTIAKE